MKKVRYAVIGLNHGQEHVEYALDAEGVDLVAMCDKHEPTLNAVGAKAPGAKRFTEYDQLLAWGEFDAAILSVPPSLHKEFGIRAIEKGKHVLIEKPLTDSLRASRELRDAVRGSASVFQVGYCVRSSPLIRRLLGMIRSGALGDIVSVWFNMFLQDHVREQAWRNSRAGRGGKLLDCMPHYFDIMRLFAGARFERLTAYGHVPGATGPNADRIPSVASVMLEYCNGVKGTHLLSEVTPVVGNGSYFGVAGTRGSVHGNPWDPQGAGSLECQLEGGLYLDTVRINGGLASRGHLGFREQHEAFLKAIATGEGNPCTADDGYEVDVMMEAIDRSLATGKTVSYADIGY